MSPACLLVALSLSTPIAQTAWPVPAEAIAVVRVADWRALRDRHEGLEKLAAPGRAATSRQRFDAGLAELAGGRSPDALTPGRPAYLAVLGFDGLLSEAPEVVAFLPAAGLKAFLAEALGEGERASVQAGAGGVSEVTLGSGRTLYAFGRDRPGYVGLTFNRDLARTYAKPFEPLDPAAVPADVREAFAGGEVGVLVNEAKLMARHGDAVRSAGRLLDLVLQANGAGWLKGFDAGQRQLARRVVGGAFQALGDGDFAALGVAATPRGVTLSLEQSFRPGTASAARLADSKLDGLAEWQNLPAGMARYNVGRPSAEVAALASELAPEFGASPGDTGADKAVWHWQTSQDKAAPAGVASFVAPKLGRAELRVAPDAEGLAGGQRRMLEALHAGARYQNLPLARRPGVSACDAHKGFALTRATLALDLDAAVAQIADENLRQATREAIGKAVSESSCLTFGHAGGRFVQLTTERPGDAAPLLDLLLDPPSPAKGDPALAAARALLPTQATSLTLAETGPLIELLAAYSRSVAGALPAFPGFEVPEFELPPKPARSYCGLAVSLAPRRVGVRVGVTAEAWRLMGQSVVTE